LAEPSCSMLAAGRQVCTRCLSKATGTTGRDYTVGMLREQCATVALWGLLWQSLRVVGELKVHRQ
jgi:hypothetical protein